jgi:hypothetical protein
MESNFGHIHWIYVGMSYSVKYQFTCQIRGVCLSLFWFNYWMSALTLCPAPAQLLKPSLSLLWN